MSANPIHPLAASPFRPFAASSPPAPQGIRWISVEEAARRSGKNIGHVRRLCGDAYFPRGLAQLKKPDHGHGKARWFVREDADESGAFARVKLPHQITPDLRAYTDAQRDKANHRLAILQRWEQHCKDAFAKLGADRTRATADFAAANGVSVRTLQLWERAYRKDGLEGLIDGRGAKADAAPASDPFLEEVKRLYLDTRRRKVALCHELAMETARMKGWEMRSYKAAQRAVAAIPMPIVKLQRYGEKAFTDHSETYIERDYSTLASNGLWNADHHQFDVFVRIREVLDASTGAVTYRHVRPWLSAWQDCRSRKIVGWCIRAEDPNTDSILLALDKAVRSHGIPDAAHVDNGKDFDSYALHGRTKKERRKVRFSLDVPRATGVFAALSIDARNVQPYHGQSKPIERFFGTLEDRFGRTWPTYCGNTPENKPEDLPDKLDAGQAPLLADFVEAFEAWLQTDYHQRAHTGDAMDGLSPAAAFDAHLISKRTAPAELLDVLLKKPTKPITVGQNGVTWNGVRFGQYAPEFLKLQGQKVTLRVDDNDLSSVQVFDLQGRFICVAAANGKLPANATSADLREAIAQKRRHKKLLKQFVEARPRMADDLPDLITRAAASRNRAAREETAPAQPPTPPSIKPLRSPFEDQLPAIQKAINARPLRLAVGSELESDAPANDVFSRLGEKLRRSHDDE